MNPDCTPGIKEVLVLIQTQLYNYHFIKSSSILRFLFPTFQCNILFAFSQNRLRLKQVRVRFVLRLGLVITLVHSVVRHNFVFQCLHILIQHPLKQKNFFIRFAVKDKFTNIFITTCRQQQGQDFLHHCRPFLFKMHNIFYATDVTNKLKIKIHKTCVNHCLKSHFGHSLLTKQDTLMRK